MAAIYDAEYDACVFSDKFRQPFLVRGYLTLDELAAIVAWKSPRQKTNVLRNVPETVEAVTRQAFSCSEPWLAVWILSYLTAVWSRAASAILTVYDPSRYSVIDVRAWSALERLGLIELLGLSRFGGIVRVNLDRPETYAAYLSACQRLAGDLDLPLRTVDRFLWTVGPMGADDLARYGVRLASASSDHSPPATALVEPSS